jgi:hypothetical protein
LANGYSVTLGVVPATPGLPEGDHMYTVVAVNYDASGNPVSLTLRNPWGIDGSGANPDGNPNDGLITVAVSGMAKKLDYLEWAAV